jgi:putative restriction endonuclease
MKIGNFGSLDPELKKRGIKGLRNASRLDQAVWNEFQYDWQSLIEESEQLIAERERAAGVPPQNFEDVEEGGKDRMGVRRVRENQYLFRSAILSAYEHKCCITGIDIETLLVASHIKPWAESDRTERLNPQNGLCLNALHDRAFDRGIVSIADDYSVVVSSRIAYSANDAVLKFLVGYNGGKINLPSRFLPRSDFLAWHRDNVFMQ